MDWITIGTIAGPILLAITWCYSRLDKRFDKIDQRFDKLDEKVTDIDRRLCRLEGAFSSKEFCGIKNQAYNKEKAE